VLPPGYVAEPRVEADRFITIGRQKTATSAWTAGDPTVAVETDPPEEYEYEVRVFDLERERQLVAAIVLVSPANKDRSESRGSFVAKCGALLRSGVAISIVDLVTFRRFTLYGQMMSFVGHPDKTMSANEPPIYAASCRWITRGMRASLQTWPHTLEIGKPLPTLPLWLDHELVVPLDLEQSYEQACRDLWIE
jgi:hypothetical protein